MAIADLCRDMHLICPSEIIHSINMIIHYNLNQLKWHCSHFIAKDYKYLLCMLCQKVRIENDEQMTMSGTKLYNKI